jgi:hypothetical protein
MMVPAAGKARRTGAALALLLLAAVAGLEAASVTQVQAQVWDVTTDWSDAANPNGPWSYREGAIPLPHVNSWQSILGGWNVAQPGWAESENGTNRLPFWFRSNGSENFAHDWITGDVVVHTTDSVNGAGNGPANLTWTSPVAGTVDLSGGVWIGRDIERSGNWTLLLNGGTLTSGSIFSGDPFSRAAPFSFAAGTGGAGAVDDIAVAPGDVLQLRFDTISVAGDFVGVRMTITATSSAAPEPATAVLLAAGVLPLAGLFVRRQRRK